jgi:hypothetical protein
MAAQASVVLVRGVNLKKSSLRRSAQGQCLQHGKESFFGLHANTHTHTHARARAHTHKHTAVAHVGAATISSTQNPHEPQLKGNSERR